MIIEEQILLYRQTYTQSELVKMYHQFSDEIVANRIKTAGNASADEEYLVQQKKTIWCAMDSATKEKSQMIGNIVNG